ncbi:MAG: beta-N-acetylhexosaminidase [Desulfobacteraceae bacterium]|nr:beta-N-acetylhexosaminidase [Desulfobacteraceae bacterium]
MRIQHLTPRQMAGQRIMAGFCGTGLNRDLKHLIGTLRVGGIILFSRNIENRSQLQRLCSDAQNYADSCGQPPLIIAVDQEGGSVARLRAPYFFEPPDAADIRDLDQASGYAERTAAELASFGINMNMAPVMDVADPDGGGIMGRRCFSADPATVAKTGVPVIRHMQQRGVMAVAKHFPGIGRTILDSHLDLPEINVSVQDLEAGDLVPFFAAIRHGVSGIMVSHVCYTAIDPLRPASLSPPIARDLLRRRMGYAGMTITDDLEMGAIANHYDIRSVVSRIIAADIDIALICHTMAKAEAAFEAFFTDLSHREGFDRASASVSRIMEAKHRYLCY